MLYIKIKKMVTIIIKIDDANCSWLPKIWTISSFLFELVLLKSCFFGKIYQNLKSQTSMLVCFY